ncbi:MAG: NYN domain-containing protein [Actinomycetota bacterium]
MTDRVVVFLDYQNVFRGARECFGGLTPSSQAGQVDPRKLAELIVSRGLGERSLQQVRVYRGQPDATRDAKGYGANDRQLAAWRSHPQIKVLTRTLRYPPGWPADPPEEKGIDVALAIDFVVMAAKREYDIGVTMSTDSDLRPALESVIEMGGARVEVAAWSAPRARRRLSVADKKIWCHWLDEAHYKAVHDATNYARSD